MADSDEESYTIPIANQRVFGAGISRKRIAFVRATSPTVPTSRPASTVPTIAEQHLAAAQKAREDQASSGNNDTSTPIESAPPLCHICEQPIRPAKDGKSIPHEASITHQLALQHSFGPSAIDRSSRGLPVMQAQGWDPDARLGLGASGEGMLYPIKLKDRPERAGLGIPLKLKVKGEQKVAKKMQNLNAKQMRRLAEMEKKDDQKMRDLFYRDEKVQQYVGSPNRIEKRSKRKQPVTKNIIDREVLEEKGRWV